MHPSYFTLASGLELEFKSFPLYFSGNQTESPSEMEEQEEGFGKFH